MRLFILLMFCGPLLAVDEPKKRGAIDETDGDGVTKTVTNGPILPIAPPIKDDADDPLAKESEPKKRGTIKPDPRDDKAAWDASLVKPRMESKRPAEVARMAESLGKPVIWWTYWPDGEFGSDESQEFFASFSDAQHVISGEHESGKGEGPRVIFLHKDGKTRWISAGKVNADTAVQVRKHWRGETIPKSQGDLPWSEPTDLTVAEKEQVFKLPVGVRGSDGSMRTTTLVAQYRAGAFTDVKAEHCRQHELNEAQVQFALSMRNEGAASKQQLQQQQFSYGGSSRFAPVQQYQQPPMTRMRAPQSAPIPARGGG